MIVTRNDDGTVTITRDARSFEADRKFINAAVQAFRERDANPCAPDAFAQFFTAIELAYQQRVLDNMDADTRDAANEAALKSWRDRFGPCLGMETMLRRVLRLA